MLELWKKRQAKHQKQMFKYLRYVLNDHFVLALLFLLGGLGLSYSNYLQTLTSQKSVSFSPMISALILWIVLKCGSLATLLRPADLVFLGPKQAEIGSYLSRAFTHSLFFSWLSVSVFYLALVPYLLHAVLLKTPQILLLWLLVLVLKYLQLERELLALYHAKLAQRWFRLLFDDLFCFLILLASFYFNALYLLLLSTMIGIFLERAQKASATSGSFLWEQAIKREQRRMLRWYRFFDLFTDVPFIQVAAKRRRYLDRFLPKASNSPTRSFTYLYWRALVRNGNYSGLYLRLSLLGMVILYFVETPWLAYVLGMLFIYLLGFQLLPLYFYYDELVFMHLYPLEKNQKLKAFSQVLFTSLALCAVVFSLVVFSSLGLFSGSISLGLLLGECLLLAGPYTKVRLIKRA